MAYFEAETADELWQQARMMLLDAESRKIHVGRGGSTYELLHVMFTLSDPRQRWIVNRHPPINIAFAIAEIIWIMRGRNDAAFLNFWNSQLPKFAGSGSTYTGAYGFRLRHHFGIDQLHLAYESLLHNPTSRQVVLQIWDSVYDLPNDHGKARNDDIPCNIVSLLKIRDQKLEWLQVMRSNDIFRGLPYNFIQWTSLHEILAGWLNVDIGAYTHLSDSLHLYEQDRVHVQSAELKTVIRNRDTLFCSKEESDKIFIYMEQVIESFMRKDLARDQLIDLFAQQFIPKSYQNLLLILGSEVARKRNWVTTYQELIERCENPALKYIWLQWLEKCR